MAAGGGACCGSREAVELAAGHGRQVGGAAGPQDWVAGVAASTVLGTGVSRRGLNITFKVQCERL